MTIEEALDCAYALIAERALWVNYAKGGLLPPYSARLFSDAETAALYIEELTPVRRGELVLDEGAVLTWRGRDYTIEFAGPQQVDLIRPDGKVRTVERGEIETLLARGLARCAPSAAPDRAAWLNKLTPAARAATTKTWREVRPFLHQDPSSVVNSRLRGLVRKAQVAAASLGDPMLAIASRIHLRGSRKRKIPEAELEFLHLFFDAAVLKPRSRRRSLRRYHEIYLRACKRQRRPFVSWGTFNREFRTLRAEVVAGKTMGHRAANAVRGAREESDARLPANGSRAYEGVHIDNWKIPILLVDRRLGLRLGSPWLTLAADALSGFIIAHVTLFDPPRGAGTLLLMRELGRLMRRFPTWVRTDNGKEFRNRMFELFNAAWTIDESHRPIGNARFGSPAERAFGRIRSAFVDFLRGVIPPIEERRQQSPGHRAEDLATWTLEEFIEALDKFVALLNDQRNDATGLSPRMIFDESIRSTGSRSHLLMADSVVFSLDFKIATAPLVKKGTIAVTGQGAKIHNLRYRFPEMAQYKGRSWPARWEPMERSTAYIHLRSGWRPMECWHADRMRGLTQAQLVDIVRRLRAGHYAVSELAIANFLETHVVETETELIEQFKAADQREVLARGPLLPRVADADGLIESAEEDGEVVLTYARRVAKDALRPLENY